MTSDKPDSWESAAPGKFKEDASPVLNRRVKPHHKTALVYVVAAIIVLSSLLAIAYLPIAPRTRTYYIAADEVQWDYTPDGTNRITGEDFGLLENVFVGDPPDRIGHIYLKALLREYLDATFTAPKPRVGDEELLGIMGPVLRAEVGDTIRVVFKNNARYPFSLHPHGVLYDKASEGAAYNDGSAPTDRADDEVAPGGMVTYLWRVPERAGPGPHDPSTVLWMYHGHVDAPGDTNAGILGPIVVGRRGALASDGHAAEVAREFFTLWTIFDENRSPFLWDNVAQHVEDQAAVELQIALTGTESAEGGPCGREASPALQRLCLAEGSFTESNLKHSVNGFLYGNGPHPSMKAGEKVRWYVMAIGSEGDLHTPHWHGQTLLWSGMRTDMTELLPMSTRVLDMVPDAVGTWLLHCHVNDHIDAGMSMLYEVLP